MSTIKLDRKKKVDGDGPITEIVTEAHASWSRGWLAIVSLGATGTHGATLSYENLSPTSTSLSRAGNGDKTYGGPFKDGFYQAHSVWRSYDGHAVAFEVRGGAWVRWLEHDELMAALATAAGRDLEAETAAAQPEADQKRKTTAAELDLPALDGTPKQVAWAEKIRQRAVETLRASIEPMPAKEPWHVEILWEEVRGRRTAKYWIDYKESAASIIEHAARIRFITMSQEAAAKDADAIPPKDRFGVGSVFGWCVFSSGRRFDTHDAAEALAADMRRRHASVEYVVRPYAEGQA